MEQTTRSSWPRLLLAGAASGVLLLSFLIPLVRSCMNEKADTSAANDGGPSLGVRILRGDKARRGGSGDVVLAGDRIRFTYSSPRDVYFALLRSSSGHAQIEYPHGAMAVPLAAAQDAAINLELQVEKRAGEDRIFGLFCEAPLELEPVRAVLEKAEELPALPSCRATQLVLQKKLE